jgi:hypothetical protein
MPNQESILLLTTDQAADWLQVPAATLKWWRHRRQGPPFILLPGSNHIRYRRDSLEAWAMEAETAQNRRRRAVPLKDPDALEPRVAR